MLVLDLTTREQACTGRSILAGCSQAGVGVQYAAQLHLAKSSHLCISAPLVLQRQLVSIQHSRAQAALEAVLRARRSLPASSRSRPAHHLRPKEERAVSRQWPEVDGGPRGPPALHVAVVQREQRVVAGQLQGHRVPGAVVDGTARDPQNV